MAGGVTFDPAEFEAYKAQAGDAAGGFDPAEFAAFKAQQTGADTGRETGAMNAAARGLVDGIPVAGPYILGGIDRADAALRAYQGGTGYGDELQKAQTYGADVKAAHPYANTAGEVAGGIVGTAPLIAAAPAAFGAGTGGLLARSVISAASGSGLEAADSAVRNDGDVDQTRRGAIAGAALGAIAPGLGAAAGAGVRSLGEMAAARAASTPGFGSPAVSKLAGDVAASGGADAVRARLADLGQSAMLMDASPSFTGRAQGLAVEPDTRAAIVAPLETRATGANARIRGDVDQALGPAADPATVRAARQQSYDATVPPLYRQAVGQPVQVDTSNVLGMIGDLRSQEKGPAADALARAWSLLHHDGDVQGVGQAMIPDRRPEALHNAKEALDSAIHQAQTQYGSAGASTVNRLGQVRGALNDALEAQVPGYADANRTAQQYFAGGDAFERGQTLLNAGRDAVRPGQLATETAGMSPMEQFMQRTGLRSEIDRHLGTTLNDRVALQRDLMGEGDFNRARMATVFGEQPTQQLASTVGREAQFDRTYNDVVRGSQTAQRAASARDIAPREVSAGSTDVLPGVATLVGGAGAGVGALASKAAMGGLKLAASSAGRQADIIRNQELARAVTMSQSDQLDALLSAIQRRGQMMQQVGAAGNAARIGTQATAISQADRARPYLPAAFPALPAFSR